MSSPRPLCRRLAPPPHSPVGSRASRRRPPSEQCENRFDEERSCLSDKTPLKLIMRLKKATGIDHFTGHNKNLFNMACNYPKSKVLRDDALRELIAAVEDAEAESAESTLKERYAKEEQELWKIAYEAYQKNIIKCSIRELTKYLKGRLDELSAAKRVSPSSAIGHKRRKLEALDVTPPASPPRFSRAAARQGGD